MFEFPEEDFYKFLNDVTGEVMESREAGLDKAAEFMMEQLENATPTDRGITKSSWERTTKYKAVRYINNTALSENKIPIVNLLEYAKNGKPFVRATFNKYESTIQQMIIDEINK